MAAVEMLQEVEPRRHQTMRPVAVEPPAPSPDLLPPGNAAPAAARAGEMMATPQADVAARAKMSVGLQQHVGNARMGAMAGKEATPPKEEAPAAEARGPKQEAPPPANVAKEAKPAAEAPAEKGGEKPAKKAGGEEPEKKPAPPSPKKAIAPAVLAVKDRATRAKTKKIGAQGLVASTQDAAKDPTTEEKRKASVSTVHQLDDAKAKQVRREEFKKALTKAMDAHMGHPKTKDEADEVMKSGGKKASTQMHGSLGAERDQAAGSMKSAAATEVQPKEGGKPPDMQTETVGAPPAPVSAEPVVPPPLPPEQLDYSSDREPTDTAMSEAGVSKTQLEKGNEPEFNKTLSQRAEGEKHEAEAEAKYRKSETVIQAQTRAAAKGELGEELGSIHGARELRLGDITGQQNATKTKDAQERERVTTKINSIKEATRKEVNEILGAMETDAASTFEKGLCAAEEAYEDVFEEEKGGVGTWLTTWGDDWDELIEKSLATAKKHYLRLVELSIDDVSNVVDLKLVAAKKRVEQGRKEVDDFVQGLEGKVKEFGVEAQNEVSAEFDAMDSEVDQRRDALIDKLAQQFKSSYERMSAKEEALREANKSLWKRIYDATVGLIKKIIAFKDMLMSVLAKAAEVVVDIITDPIGFLGNLVSAVMQGLENFMKNIGEHLQRGLMEWLFGALGGAIQLPDSFDLKGIISIVLQVLGLTYANFRARAVAIVGEPVVAALEETAEVFKIVMTQGVSGLWEYIKDKLADLKSMVMDAIFDFVKERVLIAGVTWIIGLLNPVSAFFKACKAIYDIVMFFINRASQIMALINAIIDSVVAIAKGNLSNAIKWVENALAKTIPVAISFLAALLGLGDISGTVKKTIDRAQQPVNKAIDWVIHQAVKLVKVVGKGVSSLFGKKEPEKGKATEAPAIADASGEAGHIGVAEEVGAKLMGTEVADDAEPAEVRKLLQNQAHTLESTYTKRLGAGVRLTIEFANPAEDDADEDIDFKVVIAPNTTVVKFEKGRKGFPPPVAGDYDDLAINQKHDKGSVTRERHHAPPVQFARSLGRLLTDAGDDLDKSTPAASRTPAIDAKVAMLLNVGREFTDAADQHGGKLPAILVHPNSHLKKSDEEDYIRMHGKEIRPLLDALLAQAGGTIAADTGKTKGMETSLQIFHTTVVRQVATVGTRETGTTVTETPKDISRALQAAGKQIVNKAYDAEETRAVGAVQIAMQSSKVDGPAHKREKAVNKLRGMARTAWKKLVDAVMS